MADEIGPFQRKARRHAFPSYPLLRHVVGLRPCANHARPAVVPPLHRCPDGLSECGAVEASQARRSTRVRTANVETGRGKNGCRWPSFGGVYRWLFCTDKARRALCHVIEVEPVLLDHRVGQQLITHRVHLGSRLRLVCRFLCWDIVLGRRGTAVPN